MRIFACVACGFWVRLPGPFRAKLPPDSLAALGQIAPDDCPRCLERANRILAGAYEGFLGKEPPIPTFTHVVT